MYLSLCMVINGNNVHGFYSSFPGKHLIIFYIVIFFQYIEIHAGSTLFKNLKTVKCSKSRLETFQIFFILITEGNTFRQQQQQNVVFKK